jgi:hypothetical protein
VVGTLALCWLLIVVVVQSLVMAVCTDNLNAGVVVMKSAQNGA